MSKLLQRGASSAMRVRGMSAVSGSSKVTPEQIAEWGRKINPAQSQFGPKDPSIEKWQKFFQDPINVEKPVYRRKGAIDDIIVSGLCVSVGGMFLYNIYDFIKGE